MMYVDDFFISQD